MQNSYSENIITAEITFLIGGKRTALDFVAEDVALDLKEMSEQVAAYERGIY